MKQHHLTQGSAEWHAHRSQHYNASDAPAMLGCSAYTTRAALLHRMHTGVAPEVDGATQRRFNDGHRTEALARPLGEAVIGEDLYPIVGTATVDGLPLSASFDGLTMAEDTNWECKRLNGELRAALPHSGPDSAEKNDAARLPKMYAAQMEHQCAVSGSVRVLFTAAEFDAAGQLVDERHCWYTPDPALRAEVLAGWKQFGADLASYVPPAASHIEKIVAEPVEALPAPVVQVSGQLALKDNFKVFEERLRHFLEHRLIREPKSDQDFIDLDAQIKAMKQAREALGAAEAQMLAQVQPVDQAKKTKDMLDKLLQQNLSMAERLLKDEKERRRGDIVAGGMKALADHVAALNARLGKSYMPQVPADFGGCVKGLKSLASMEDKVATELARAKIAANEVADKIDANLRTLRELASEYRTLFADAATLVLKAPDDCRAVITSRITEHKAAEERRAAELAERERDRIRREEAARLEREQQAREIEEHQQRVAAEQEQRRREANTAASAAMDAIAGAREAGDLPAILIDGMEQAATGIIADLAVGRAAESSANVVHLQRPSPAAAQPATLTLGAICIRFGFTMTADFVRRLGIEPAATEKAAKLYTEAQFQLICEALVAHVRTVQAKQEAA